MLVLSRKKGEKIIISDKAGNVLATIVVMDLERGKARIGINAGQEFVIHRAEIYTKIFGKPAETDGERLPHPAVRMNPLDHTIDVLPENKKDG